MVELPESFEEAAEPDRRWQFFVRPDGETGTYHRITQLDLYAAVAHVRLNDSVPDGVRHQFLIARDLCVQSWYRYEFNVQAGMVAAFSVERALRLRLADEKTTFEKLTRRAERDGVLSTFDAERVDGLRELRNSAAHGGRMVHNLGPLLLANAAEIINRLYPS